MGRPAWKLIKFLYAQRIGGFDPPDAPHLDAETLARLRQELSRASLYLEFGSGGSTLLADSMGVRTISVESDRYYARTIRAALKGSKVSILTPDIGITGRWGWPLFQKPTARRLKRWRSYVDMPFAGLAEFPDIVMVDGRFRVACALETARQAFLRGREATLILDDYASRPGYRTVEQWLGPGEMVGRSAIFRIGTQAVPAVERYDPA